MHRTPFVAAALAAAVLSSPACSPSPERGPSWEPVPTFVRSAVRLMLSVPAGADPAIDALVSGPGSEWLVTGAEMRTSALNPTPHSAWYPMPGAGTLSLRVALHGSRGEELGSGSLELPLEGGWLWTVEALVWRPAPDVPPPPCLQCAAEWRGPLRPDAPSGIAAGDSLFLRAVRLSRF